MNFEITLLFTRKIQEFSRDLWGQFHKDWIWNGIINQIIYWIFEKKFQNVHLMQIYSTSATYYSLSAKIPTKGGFFSERADVFVISPNRQT